MSFLWRMAALSWLAILCVSPVAAQDDAGFVSIFDGKTLTGWDGDPQFWSVEDGCLTGITTKEKPTKGNTFIVWGGGEVADFELELEYKIVGGNSGIQYRSFELPSGKWRIGGYQADFESGDRYSGINYGEAFRGILCDRGNVSEVTRNAEGKVVVKVKEKLGDTAELGKAVKKEDWNTYRITARGFELEHAINNVVMSRTIDSDEMQRRSSGLLALQLHAGPPMKVQFRNIRLKKLPSPVSTNAPAGATAKKKIIFLAGGPSHGFGSHDHLAGCKLLAQHLSSSLGYETVVHYRDWPTDIAAYDGADCVVMYSDGGGGHPVNARLAVIDEVAKRGVGIACIHYAVEVPKGPSGEKFLDWIGGYFETHWSVNPHWNGTFDKFPDHPVARGVQPFTSDDEWYYHMRFRPEMKGVTPILSALPPPETLSRKDGPHSGNPDVRRDVLEKKEPQHVAWVAERAGGGRGFGFTGGHNHWNWGEPNFRKVVLNAIVWCAKDEVPAGGVSDTSVTFEDLLANPDENIPANFNKEGVIQKFRLKSTGAPVSVTPVASPAKSEGKSGNKASAAAKPVASTKVITPATPGMEEKLVADIRGAKELYLVVNDGGDGFGCDWALWAEPKLVGPAGEKKLTELSWKSASASHGEVRVNKNSGNQPMRINGKEISNGIGTHAVSVIAYDLPAGYEKLETRCGLDDGGTKQGCGSTVQFLVYTENPGEVKKSQVAASAVGRDPELAVPSLDVAEGLEATLFSSEPQISNITSIDIDAQGRVWACEVKNYRRWNNSRPEGDRVLVLEDTNSDGVADKSTVFYQGRDIDSAHGICVLGNRVIISAGDKVQSFYDDDGDLKCDRKEVLFSGISGTQHDHGIHAFLFGPDGKLYFNFGNSGHQLKDKNGQPVIDQAGNEIKASRRPYQEGMVFRCNLDGSQVETLGWNFRNNWEVTIDSFGTLWQSDNDDDGNKGVRINYVMEFGNYGYKDERTGAGWNQQRTNWESEIPQRHWHLNDPGVVPTLLLTGAGSPTGICVYEGTLLPEPFRGQMIHCDAGPNVCRAYPVKSAGAGYTAETVNVLHGKRDNWFRPSDVAVATDGSLFVADWYDPGVGGHNQQEVDKGRIFRVAPPGSKYHAPKYDFTTAKGAAEALRSPNHAARYLAWQALQANAAEAESALAPLLADRDPRVVARALWLLGKLPNKGAAAIERALASTDADLRTVAVRLARQLPADVTSVVSKLVKDSSPAVRRECAIALRGQKSPSAAALWATLAQQHDGQDRWYLEALGIGAEGQWDAFLAAWLANVNDGWDTPAGRDIVWRSRAKQTPELLAKILKNTKAEDQPRYFRAFDFLTGPEKENALKSLLDL